MSNDGEDYTKAKNYALRVLTYRQRTEHEMREKLQQKEYSADTINIVLEFLKGYHLIDDYKYACQWVEYRLKTKPVGIKGIKYQLRQRGIDDETVEKAVCNVTIEIEKDLARELVRKKIRTSSKKPSYRNMAAMLQRRGFSYDTIIDVLSDWER